MRFLFAGQPPNAYPEYPVFLCQAHALVKRHEIEVLLDKDIETLWRSRKPPSFVSPDEAVIHLLALKGQGRTLPTVYAVEDIRYCPNVAEARLILDSRPLADSLHSYYDGIWSAAVHTLSEGAILTAVFVLLQERPNGEILASALGRTPLEWTTVLRRLRPLVRETPQGFELVHNDLRVHLDSKLSEDPSNLREVALALAGHYRKKISNRAAAHNSLLRLLHIAGAEVSFATDFNVEWIIEAGALNKTDALSDQCVAAYKGAVLARDWKLLHSVACASLTLHRLIECLERSDETSIETIDVPSLPPFFLAESESKALELWGRGDLAEIIFACTRLLDYGDAQRAVLIVRQWLGSISIEQLIAQFSRTGTDNGEHEAEAKYLDELLERFGQVSEFILRVHQHSGIPAPQADQINELARRAAQSGRAMRFLEDYATGLLAERTRKWSLPELLEFIEPVKPARGSAHFGETKLETQKRLYATLRSHGAELEQTGHDVSQFLKQIRASHWMKLYHALALDSSEMDEANPFGFSQRDLNELPNVDQMEKPKAEPPDRQWELMTELRTAFTSVGESSVAYLCLGEGFLNKQHESRVCLYGGCVAERLVELLDGPVQANFPRDLNGLLWRFVRQHRAWMQTYTQMIAAMT